MACQQEQQEQQEQEQQQEQQQVKQQQSPRPNQPNRKHAAVLAQHTSVSWMPFSPGFIAGRKASSFGGVCVASVSQSTPAKNGCILICAYPPITSQPRRFDGSRTSSCRTRSWQQAARGRRKGEGGRRWGKAVGKGGGVESEGGTGKGKGCCLLCCAMVHLNANAQHTAHTWAESGNPGGNEYSACEMSRNVR